MLCLAQLSRTGPRLLLQVDPPPLPQGGPSPPGCHPAPHPPALGLSLWSSPAIPPPQMPLQPAISAKKCQTLLALRGHPLLNVLQLPPFYSLLSPCQAASDTDLRLPTGQSQKSLLRSGAVALLLSHYFLDLDVLTIPPWGS